MPNIRLEGVHKHYDGIRAADGLEFSVKDGEYICLLGPTGAGKTTALRIIAGLTEPDSGRILFDDKDVTSVEPEDRKAVLLSQTYSLFPRMTVAENILFGPNIRNWPEEARKKTLANMLDLVRLTRRSDAYPKELSGGMQQRTALARALASGAEVLLLDEPLRALDARLRVSLRYELRSLVKSLGITTIHVTHDQDEALVMADRIAVVRHGRVLQMGTPMEVFDKPDSPFVANFVGQSNFFQGSVVRADDRIEVRDEQGRSAFARATRVELGEKVVVGVKVGNTEIAKEWEGYLQGVVERVLFEGRNLFIDVMVAGLGRFSSRMPAGRDMEFAVGDKVSIGWNPDKATVFTLKDRSLYDELKVE
jgi:ABC-type Fe3+/spermidine/putrescine transport system ATPase subunit